MTVEVIASWVRLPLGSNPSVDPCTLWLTEPTSIERLDALKRHSWTIGSFFSKPVLSFFDWILHLQNKPANVKTGMDASAELFVCICQSLHCGFKAEHQTSSKNLWHFYINKCLLCYHWLTLHSSDSIYIQFLKDFPVAGLHSCCLAALFFENSWGWGNNACQISGWFGIT